MNEQSIEAAARLVWDTWQSGGKVREIPQAHRPGSRVEGYQVQARVAKLSAQGLFGWKIAATSVAGQKHIGVDGPLAGRLLSKRAFDSGATVSLANNIMKVAEAEFAFRMARDLPPKPQPYTVEEVLAAVDTLHPAIEIPDSRYEEFAKVGAPQLIADCACACYFVLGAPTVADWRRMDLVEHPVKAWVDGRLAREGKGANVLGDPRVALAWIANELSLAGDMLRAGQVVTTGTCVVPVEIAGGNHVVADFGAIGSVEARLA
ncbi:MAG TPA: fumarylacetoacetate hydrolase family protein [Burkholderiales bacterium]|nr:fumarylacetoacetate hydrolase family protein [Burkholderiales bacterium]